MKTMMKTVAKALAKWLLGYVGDAVVATVKTVNERTANAAYREEVLTVVEHLSANMEQVASSMRDGFIDDAEAARLKEMIDMDMEQIKGLL